MRYFVISVLITFSQNKNSQITENIQSWIILIYQTQFKCLSQNFELFERKIEVFFLAHGFYGFFLIGTTKRRFF